MKDLFKNLIQFQSMHNKINVKVRIVKLDCCPFSIGFFSIFVLLRLNQTCRSYQIKLSIYRKTVIHNEIVESHQNNLLFFIPKNERLSLSCWLVIEIVFAEREMNCLKTKLIYLLM